MQTVHHSRKSTRSHHDTIVDLTEYRRRLGAVDGSLALNVPPEPAAPRRPVRTVRRRKRRTLSDWLDAVATLILIAVAVTVLIQLII